MILYVYKFDIHPDKAEEYAKWAEMAVPKILAVPGYTEIRGYRPVLGSSHSVVTIEFADFEAWTTWFANETVQKMTNERRAFTLNETSELWGQSPHIAKPVRSNE